MQNIHSGTCSVEYYAEKNSMAHVGQGQLSQSPKVRKVKRFHLRLKPDHSHPGHMQVREDCKWVPAVFCGLLTGVSIFLRLLLFSRSTKRVYWGRGGRARSVRAAGT